MPEESSGAAGRELERRARGEGGEERGDRVEVAGVEVAQKGARLVKGPGRGGEVLQVGEKSERG